MNFLWGVTFFCSFFIPKFRFTVLAFQARFSNIEKFWTSLKIISMKMHIFLSAVIYNFVWHYVPCNSPLQYNSFVVVVLVVCASILVKWKLIHDFKEIFIDINKLNIWITITCYRCWIIIYCVWKIMLCCCFIIKIESVLKWLYDLKRIFDNFILRDRMWIIYNLWSATYEKQQKIILLPSLPLWVWILLYMNKNLLTCIGIVIIFSIISLTVIVKNCSHSKTLI